MRSPDSIREEIEVSKKLKESLALKVGVFIDEGNDKLDTLYIPILLVRSTDKARTHIIYRSREPHRKRYHTLPALLDSEETTQYRDHFDYLLELDLHRTALNRYWALHEYNYMLAQQHFGKLIDLKAHLPKEFSDYFSSKDRNPTVL